MIGKSRIRAQLAQVVACCLERGHTCALLKSCLTTSQNDGIETLQRVKHAAAHTFLLFGGKTPNCSLSARNGACLREQFQALPKTSIFANTSTFCPHSSIRVKEAQKIEK